MYLLAASAREILTTLGEKIGVRTVLHGIAETMKKPSKDLIAVAHKHANFLKHARRDPQGILAEA